MEIAKRSCFLKKYSAFQTFGQAKFAYGGLVLGSQLPHLIAGFKSGENHHLVLLI